jgi:hypothetical protein
MGLLSDIKNKIADNFTSASFEVDPEMTVKELKVLFNKKFGLSLRVYKGRQFADEKTKLKDIIKGEHDDKKFTIKGVHKVIEVENEFKKHFGVTVQVADRLNDKLAANDRTLGEIARD